MIITYVIIIMLTALGTIVAAFIITFLEDRFFSKTIKIPFEGNVDPASFPVITLYNNGNPVSFLVDSGSNISHINSSELGWIKYEDIKDSNMSIVGMEGNEVIVERCTIELTCNGKTIVEEFAKTNLDSIRDTIMETRDIEIEGILGGTFLKKNSGVINYNDMRLYIK